MPSRSSLSSLAPSIPPLPPSPPKSEKQSKCPQIFVIPAWLWNRPEADLTFQVKLLFAVIEFYSKKFGKCTLGQEKLARIIGRSRRTVIRYLAVLEKYQLLRSFGRRDNTNMYFVDFGHPWRTEGLPERPHQPTLEFARPELSHCEVPACHTDLEEPCGNTNMVSSSSRTCASEADDETQPVEKKTPTPVAPPRQPKLQSVQPPPDPTLSERHQLAEQIVSIVEELISLGARTEPIRNKAGYLHTLAKHDLPTLNAELSTQQALLAAARSGPTRSAGFVSTPLWLTAQADAAERHTLTGCAEPWLSAWSDLPESEQGEWRSKAEHKLFEEKLLGEGKAVDRELRIRRVARNLFREKWEAEQAAVVAETPKPAENSLEEIWERPDFELGGFVSRAVAQLAEEGVDLEDYEGREAAWHAMMQERAVALYHSAKAAKGTDDATDDGWNGDRVQAGTDIAVEIHQVEATDEPNGAPELLTLGVNAIFGLYDSLLNAGAEGKRETPAGFPDWHCVCGKGISMLEIEQFAFKNTVDYINELIDRLVAAKRSMSSNNREYLCTDIETWFSKLGVETGQPFGIADGDADLST